MVRTKNLIQILQWSTLLALLIIATVVGVHLLVPRDSGPGGNITSFTIEAKSYNGFDDNLTISVSNFADAEAKNEIRSIPVYSQSRPTYQKPTPYKPKLVLAKQLQIKKEDTKSGDNEQQNGNPNIVTQTVYGFLDFVTTIGNTVMVFTPQSKGIIVPSATIGSENIVVKPTQVPEPTQSEVQNDASRMPKLIKMKEEDKPIVTLESSEYELSTIPSSITSVVTPGALPSDFEYDEMKSEILSTSIEPEERSQAQIHQITPIPEVSTTSKGFTLKFSKHSTVKSEPVLSDDSIGKQIPELPTGLISQNFETRINNGRTTVHETKILGTYIGKHYARVLESSSSILPIVVTATKANFQPIQKTKTVSLASIKSSAPIMSNEHKSVPEHTEFHTERSVISSSNVEFRETDDSEPKIELEKSEDSKITVEPTPTASDEQTHYILPEKEEKPEKLYTSVEPSPNAYSRQPQIYVEVSPAKSFDYIVTATPTRKQFTRQQNSRESANRFSQNRIKNPPTSTESNDLTYNSESASDESSRRTPNRFRSRNRSGSKPRQAVEEVSSVASSVAATPTRRFTPSTRGRNNGKHYQEPATFKTPTPSRGGYTPASKHVIIPTSSSSIYRFKLNRPTGRWRFKPSPKPKVNIIKTKEGEDLLTTPSTQKEVIHDQYEDVDQTVYSKPIQEHSDPLEVQTLEETRTQSNELDQDVGPELAQQTLRVATITPTDFSELGKFLEVATIRSPYVFQAGNVKNTRYITVTKTATKDMIQPTQASAFNEPTPENILATRPPYEKILEGSNDIATLPLVILGSDMATPPLETVTQTFSTTQLMLKTSILPALYDGVTTLYTLTQSYFITRLVTAHKTVPPMELFQFVPTKSLNEFNTALQEAGSEHRDLLSSESETSENDANYEHIVAPPDELTSVGSDFDPSAMEEKISNPGKGHYKAAKALPAKAAPTNNNNLENLTNLTPEQLAILRYFSAQQSHQQPINPMQNLSPNYYQPQLPQLLPSIQPQYQLTTSSLVLDTVTTIVESKTLRIQFGAKASLTTIYSTKIVPTKVTTFVTNSVPATAAIPYFPQAPFPLAYVG